MHGPCSTTLLCGLLIISGSASAQFLQVPDIPGESSEVNHQDWIELTGYSVVGPIREGEMATFAISKHLDASSPMLVQACLDGQQFDGVVIELMQPADPGSLLCRLTLDGAMIGAVNQLQQDGASPVESVTLGFTRIVYRYEGNTTEPIELTLDQINDIADADGDGMDDSWEELYGLRVGIKDGDLDADSDGRNNRDEFLAGTDPTSGSSFFTVFIEPHPDLPEKLLLRWPSRPGTSYRIMWSPDLVGTFALLNEVTADATVSEATVNRQAGFGFFKVEVAP